MDKEIEEVREKFEPTGAVENPLEPTTRSGLLAALGLGGIPRRAWLVTLLSLGGWLLVNADGSLFNFTYPLIQKDLGLSDNQIHRRNAAAARPA